MPKQTSPREAQLRLRVAQEAARLMLETGIRDFAQAKRKASARLGLATGHPLPSNREIEEALAGYQRLFRSESQPRRLRELRETASRAMELLGAFLPRLVGPVLAGTADEHSPVHIHLFADTPEEVGIFLMEHRIPYELDERVVRPSPGQTKRFPLFRFLAGQDVVELTVFPVAGLRQAPLSPVDGRPMERADIKTVRSLLSETN